MTDSSVSGRRRNTRSLIFNYIFDSDRPCTKLDIAKGLNLSFPTVYHNLAELEERGYIEPCGELPSTGGRPATSYKVVKNIRTAIGISMTSHHLDFAAADLSKTETAIKTVQNRFLIDDPNYFRFVADELEVFIDENGIDREKLLGVGITLAGIVMPDNYTVLYAPTLYMRDISLQALSDLIPYPVYIENDASSGGYAEWCRDQAQTNIAFISLSEGVGGAILLNGEQYTGNNFRSGEFGHMCVEYNGRPCTCGKKGCLEAYCSSARIVGETGATVEDFFSQLSGGDALAVNLWEDYKKHLVIGIHNIRMAFDCDIVLGGELSEFIEPYLPELRALSAELDPFDKDAAYLRVSRAPKYSSILGVALGFIRDFISDI